MNNDFLTLQIRWLKKIQISKKLLKQREVGSKFDEKLQMYLKETQQEDSTRIFNPSG